MSPGIVRSPRNRGVSDALALHKARERRTRRETLIEGPHVLSAALEADWQGISTVFVSSGDSTTIDLCVARGLRVVEVTADVMARLAPSVHPRGPVAVVDIPPPAADIAGPIVVLVAISDPGNVGTLIRSAGAMGFAVATTPGSADPWAPKVLRAGAGAHFVVPMVAVDDPVHSLRSAGIPVVATVPRAGTWPPPFVDGPVAVLIGNETAGLPEDMISAADVRVTIPMKPGVESLNAAMAGTIVMYEMAKAGLG